MIGRLARIVGGYLAASLAAGSAVALVLMLWPPIVYLLNGGWPPLPVPPSTATVLLAATLGASFFAALYAFIPAALVIAVAEARGLRSAAYYGGAGTVAAIAAICIFSRTLQLPASALLTLGAAGLVGGLVYWRIAGRSAGTWGGAPRASPWRSYRPDVRVPSSQAPSSPQT